MDWRWRCSQPDIVRGSASTRPGAVHGGSIWATPVQYHWSTHADWRPRSWFRWPKVATRMPTGLHCVAEDRSNRWPPATSRIRQQEEQELAASGGAGHEISAAAVGQAGYRQYPACRRQVSHRFHRSAYPGEPGSGRSRGDLQLGGAAGNHHRKSVLRRGEEQHHKPRAGTQRCRDRRVLAPPQCPAEDDFAHGTAAGRGGPSAS